MIQVDIDASEIGNAVPAAVGLVGDAKAIARQLLDAAPEAPLPIDAWRRTLSEASASNAAQVATLIDADDAPMNFYRMYRDIADVLDDDATVVADGESTQAVSRVMLPNGLPRHRLDAGTGGCMGVAVPYAIGAQVARPEKQVVCLNGDFAFGWNGMEVETAARYQLPIVFIVANNRSIAMGGSYGRYGYGEVPESDDPLRYDQMMDALGGRGEFVADPAQLRPALERAFTERKPTLLNVLIDKNPQRKPQEVLLARSPGPHALRQQRRGAKNYEATCRDSDSRLYLGPTGPLRHGDALRHGGRDHQDRAPSGRTRPLGRIRPAQARPLFRRPRPR